MGIIVTKLIKGKILNNLRCFTVAPHEPLTIKMKREEMKIYESHKGRLIVKKNGSKFSSHIICYYKILGLEGSV